MTHDQQHANDTTKNPPKPEKGSSNETKKDRFWPWYLGVLAITISASASFFVFGAIQDSRVLNELDIEERDVPLTIDLEDEPFQEVPIIFQNRLARGWQDWSDGVTTRIVLTRHKETQTEDEALQAVFGERDEGAGSVFYLHAPHFTTDPYETFLLHVYNASPSPWDGIIELYDENLRTLGGQSLSWYTGRTSIPPHSWKEIRIPLSNLNARNTQITGFSIWSEDKGSILIKDIRFDPTPTQHARWIPPWKREKKEKSEPVLATADTPSLDELFSHQGALFETDLWQSRTGSLQIEPERLLLRPNERESSSLAVFSEGSEWRDHTFSAETDWGENATVSLIARYADEKNFVTCSFHRSGNTVALYQTTNGISSFLEEARKEPGPAGTARKNVNAIRVRGNEVACLQNEKVLLQRTLSSLPEKGTIGVSTWHHRPSDSTSAFTNLTVNEIK